MTRQSALALVGGGFLGLVAGAALGGVLGRAFITIEPWQKEAYYGLFAVVQRVRGIGIGAFIGGLIGLLMGAGYAAIPSRMTGKRSPESDRKSVESNLD